ncbi:MAG: hypothetical protein NT154_44190 [Verrucomicrobia bacterium]|nr:hypothetical protein [Verrucomicrobiota bacterium]
MSITEIKASIDQMTDEESFFAAAYLQHRAQTGDPAYQALLSERMKCMDAGQMVTLEKAQRTHKALEAAEL